jgi:hypothetical protein
VLLQKPIPGQVVRGFTHASMTPNTPHLSKLPPDILLFSHPFSRHNRYIIQAYLKQEKELADVFMSYDSRDRERIRALVELLESNGVTVWWDRQISVGSSFHREIEQQLALARCVVVVWSENLISSDWVRNEATDGLERDLLVPARIDDVKVRYRQVKSPELIESVDEYL